MWPYLLLRRLSSAQLVIVSPVREMESWIWAGKGEALVTWDQSPIGDPICLSLSLCLDRHHVWLEDTPLWEGSKHHP
jgi:hypothetical protein